MQIKKSNNIKEIIEMLEKEYPERCPDFNDTDRDIFYYKGKVDLVKQLKRQHIEVVEETELLNIKDM